MAPLYYCPAIVSAVTPFFLPPWLDVDIVRSQTVDFQPIPQWNNGIITSVRPNQGTRINITASGVVKAEQSQASILALLEAIYANMSGEDNTFTFFLYNDRGWPGCALESQREHFGYTEMHNVMQDTQLSIICPYNQPDTNLQLTFSNFNEEYPYADIVGRPLGDAVTPGEVVALMQSLQTPHVFFPGQPAVTDAGAEHRIIIGGETGSQWSLRSLQITWSNPGDASGTTTVRASTAPVGGSGSNINATVGVSANYGAVASGAITLTAGDSIYVYIPTGGAGGHANIECNLIMKAL
jgi:hypothetical protein